LNYLSVCSGIEAATVAWHEMGWNPLAFSEIEKFPSQVLAHHYPNVPNLGDMTKFKEWDFGTNRLDLLVGGTPCQSFSVAGLRKGLDDPRGNLALTYVAILDKFRPKWCIWENVPGVLSSNKGRDFGAFLGALVELGYGWSYRVLDAQNFGVAQRRRRVFVVGCLGDWKPAAEVLFESESLSGDIKQSRKEREETAKCLTTRIRNDYETESFITIPIHAQATQFSGGGNNRNDDDKGNGLGIGKPGDPMNTLDTSSRHAVAYVADKSPTILSSAAGFSRPGNAVTEHETYIAVGFNTTDVHAVAFAQNQLGEVREANIFNTLNTNSNASGRNTPLLRQNMAVRRLTEVECERLQGFPDNYTNIRENCPSGSRYKALGNSMAVPVMKWIGERINKYEKGEI
jgi:DNA (cytosine-5)-methyltransferase 1